MDSELEKFIHDVQYAFLKSLIEGLRDGSMSIGQARAYAVDFKKLEPFSSREEIETKIKGYSEKNPHFEYLYNFVETYNKEKKMGEIISKMKTFIKEDKIDEALAVANEK